MNREIKFRFWEEASKMFIYDIDKLSKNPSVLISKVLENKDIIMPQQFTGLKDSDGKDIYEGDVLKVLRKGLGIVEWYNYGFIIRLKNEIIWPELFFHVSGNYSIIGNVNETPELKTGF